MIKNRIYLGNINSEANETEIKVFVEKYCEGEVTKITQVDQNSKEGSHCYIIEIKDSSEYFLEHLNNTVTRLHDMWWKERHIFANLI